MKKFEKFFVVHQPVKPIKISIVNKNHQNKRKIKINLAILVNISIKFSEWSNGIIQKHKDGWQRKNHNRQNRVKYLSFIILRLRKFELDFFERNLFFQDDIKKQKGDTRNKGVVTRITQ